MSAEEEEEDDEAEVDETDSDMAVVGISDDDDDVDVQAAVDALAHCNRDNWISFDKVASVTCVLMSVTP